MNSKSTNLIALFETAIRSNMDNTALSDYGGESFTYKVVGERIAKIHGLFRAAGIQKGARFPSRMATWNIGNGNPIRRMTPMTWPACKLLCPNRELAGHSLRLISTLRSLSFDGLMSVT